MTLNIPKTAWKDFFDDLSKRRFEWKTDVEVLNEDIGDQLLSEGLPLNGITAEEENGVMTIEILVGEGTDKHQTHNVANPARVAFYAKEGEHGGTLEIEEENGTKTLVRISEPRPIEVGYDAYLGAAAGG